MGWSCRKDAADTMQAIDRALAKDHAAPDGGSNTWKHGDRVYFYECDNVEHDDGAITGDVYLMLPTDGCRRAGSYRIEGDGRIARFYGLPPEVRALGRRFCPNHPDREAASPSSNLCGPCLMGRSA